MGSQTIFKLFHSKRETLLKMKRKWIQKISNIYEVKLINV